MVTYSVEYRTFDNQQERMIITCDDLPYAHSSHLIHIMQLLDNQSADLISITVA